MFYIRAKVIASEKPSERCLPDKILSGVSSVLHVYEAVSFCILQASIKVCNQVISHILAVDLHFDRVMLMMMMMIIIITRMITLSSS